MENEEIIEVKRIEEEKTITLRKTVEYKTVTYEKLDLREPTAGELAKANKAGDGVDSAISLISIIANVPRGAVEMISQRDFQEANEYLGGFTINGQRTGETSSLI